MLIQNFEKLCQDLKTAESAFSKLEGAQEQLKSQ